MAMSDDLNAIQERVQEALAGAHSLEDLEKIRVAALGKKGSLTAIMHMMGKVPPEERPAMGKLANTVRANVDSAIKQARLQIAKRALDEKIMAEAADVTLPGRRLSPGTEHLISQIREEIEDIFCGLGYTVEDGPYVETTYYNFTALNAPEDHPSRSAKDTFYVVDNAPEGKEVHVQGESDVLLRTQTSGVQAHVMEAKEPPIYMICPGTVFRPDTADANHLPQFTQRRMSTWAICGSLSSLSRAKSASTLAAAAEPCATEAGMSLAPWQTPARNTPAVLVSTGLSFTWLSMKKP